MLKQHEVDTWKLLNFDLYPTVTAIITVEYEQWPTVSARYFEERVHIFGPYVGSSTGRYRTGTQYNREACGVVQRQTLSGGSGETLD